MLTDTERLLAKSFRPKQKRGRPSNTALKLRAALAALRELERRKPTKKETT